MLLESVSKKLLYRLFVGRNMHVARIYVHITYCIQPAVRGKLKTITASVFFLKPIYALLHPCRARHPVSLENQSKQDQTAAT